jgi:hypothetical protein
MAKRRRLDQHERRRLADRLRAIMAASRLTETAIGWDTGLGQPFICRFLDCDYQFETENVARLTAYVVMRETEDNRQLELPFETTVALNRFLRANGDVDLLNSLIDVLAARTGR